MHDESSETGADGPLHERILLSPAALECIEKCLDCHHVALQTFDYCVARGGVYAPSRLVHLILDCAEVTQLSADWLRRGSELHHAIVALCAQTCAACDERCASFHDDEEIGKLARSCQLCVEACREIQQTHQAASDHS